MAFDFKNRNIFLGTNDHRPDQIIPVPYSMISFLADKTASNFLKEFLKFFLLPLPIILGGFHAFLTFLQPYSSRTLAHVPFLVTCSINNFRVLANDCSASSKESPCAARSKAGE